jgi:hypothetical protein
MPPTYPSGSTPTIPGQAGQYWVHDPYKLGTKGANKCAKSFDGGVEYQVICCQYGGRVATDWKRPGPPNSCMTTASYGQAVEWCRSLEGPDYQVCVRDKVASKFVGRSGCADTFNTAKYNYLGGRLPAWTSRPC